MTEATRVSQVLEKKFPNRVTALSPWGRGPAGTAEDDDPETDE